MLRKLGLLAQAKLGRALCQTPPRAILGRLCPKLKLFLVSALAENKLKNNHKSKQGFILWLLHWRKTARREKENIITHSIVPFHFLSGPVSLLMAKSDIKLRLQLK